MDIISKYFYMMYQDFGLNITVLFFLLIGYALGSLLPFSFVRFLFSRIMRYIKFFRIG